MKRRWRRLICTVLSVMMVLAGCSSEPSTGTAAGGSDSSGTAGAGETFVIGVTSEARSLDPAYNYNQNEFITLNHMYDTLLVFSADGTELLPSLVTSWEIVDELTYVYQLRDDVTFWDGNKMTVEDVVYSLNRIMDPATAANTAFLFANVASIEATGEWEFTVKLSAPDALWKYVPATVAGQVVEKAYVEEKGDSFGTAEGGTMATGPYMFESWVSGSQFTYKKNPNYWDKAAELLFDEVDVVIMTDETALAVAASSGQVDMVVNFSTDNMGQYQKSAGLDVIYSEGPNNAFIAMNNQRAPFDDVNVRKAVACAIDEVSITTSTKAEYATPAGALDFDVEIMGFETEDWNKLEDSLTSYSYNVEKAKEYLAQSAYPDGFTCNFLCGSGSTRVAEIVQYNLKELNINVEIIPLTASELLSYVYGSVMDDSGARDYDMISYGWLPDYLDPANYLQPFYQGINAGAGGSNCAGYQNEEVDKLLEAQLQTTDVKERSQLMMDAYKIINEDCPYKLLNYFGNTLAINNKYHYELSPMWIYNINVKDITLAQ